jgi:hypothetical protein
LVVSLFDVTVYRFDLFALFKKEFTSTTGELVYHWKRDKLRGLCVMDLLLILPATYSRF